MTTRVLADNTVKIPDAIVRLMGLEPGTALDLQVADDGTLIVYRHRTRGERADRLLGIGRPFLKPGEDPVAELVEERAQEDLHEYGRGHARP